MMQRDKKYIAFVCSGNTCRSPMAEGIFNKLAEENELDAAAESFGMETISGLSVSENSVVVCREIDVDLSSMHSHSVNDVDINKYDKFYCMSLRHSLSLRAVYGVSDSKIEVMNVSDPFGGDENIYRQCRNQIYDFVCKLIKEYEN